MNTAAEAIALESTCRVAGVVALKEVADASASDLVIDAGAVESIDAAALQLLVMLRRHCMVLGRGFVLRSVSDAFAAAARTVSLDAALDLAAGAEA